MKIIHKLLILLLFAAIPLLRAHERELQERRARIAADWLHRHLDQTTDDFRVLNAFHGQNAVCFDYLDGSAEIEHALYVDRSAFIEWNVDDQDKDWLENCVTGVGTRDLTAYVRTEDR